MCSHVCGDAFAAPAAHFHSFAPDAAYTYAD